MNLPVNFAEKDPFIINKKRDFFLFFLNLTSNQLKITVEGSYGFRVLINAKLLLVNEPNNFLLIL